MDASAVRKAVNSDALRKALATPFLSSNVSVPLGDVVDGIEPAVEAMLPDFPVDVVLEVVKDCDSEDGSDGNSGISNDPVCEVPEEGPDKAEEGPDKDKEDTDDPMDSTAAKEALVELEDSVRVTTLIPMPSLLHPGIKRVVEPSLRII